VNALFWFLLILLLFLFLLLLIIFTKLTILVNYQHHNNHDDLRLEFRIWFGLIRYKRHIPLEVDLDSQNVKGKSEKPSDSEGNDSNTTKPIDKQTKKSHLETAKELLGKISGLKVIISKFMKKVKVKKFEWYTLIGLGDAAHTGTTAGALWAIKGGALGVLSNYLTLAAQPDISITPHFQASVIQTRISCIFEFRIGHAILAGIKLIKFWRGGKATANDEPNYSNQKMNSV
jgi:hypothetical protein